MSKLETNGEGVDYKQIVEEALVEATNAQSWVSVAASEALKAGGKRIRPILALLTCEAISGDYRPAIPVALAYELAHSASLIQDDIIDESQVRHSAPTAHAKYGITRAILISDMLIFEIFSQIARYKDTKVSKGRLAELLEYISRAAKEAAEGEFLEASLKERGSMTEADYVKVAGLKTGALFAAASASGAVVAGGDRKLVEDMREYGLDLGIAFQIQDDILDFTGQSKTTGKPIFKDMQNNACNIVLVHALAAGDVYKRNTISSMLYRKWFGISDAKKLLVTLTELGSLENATVLAEKYATRCRQLLAPLKPTPARQKLEKLTRLVGSRSE
ncbi:MAG: polyprenyl synthetase family protein [Thaumarchaeota archaeon]|nr:polyprenyl synthetase family protein [Nitrososphaerota archaeon]